jgi:hypothetical protein
MILLEEEIMVAPKGVVSVDNQKGIGCLWSQDAISEY